MERRSLRLLRLASATALLAVPAVLAAQQRMRVVDLVIASTTDVHGRIRGWDYYADTAEGGRGLSRAATIVDSVRAANPGRVLLVDAGDLLQGNPFTYVSREGKLGAHPVIAAMNAMRYDAVAVGNHEFNYGVPAFDRAAAQAKFAFLAANARSLDGKKRWMPFTLVERQGVKVGIIGVTNPGSMVWDRENLKGKVVIDDILPAVRRNVEAARAAGAQVIVVVAHAGLDGAASYDTVSTKLGSENPMATVARKVPGIDLIVFGHSHRELADTVINDVLLTQPRNWATSVSVAHLAVRVEGERATVTTRHADLVRATGHAEETAVAAASDAGHRAARSYATAVIGTTAVDWRADSARVVDTPIMDFVLEVMRKASGADLASAAAFSLDARIAKGNITVAQLAQLYPYENTLKSLRITGKQLREYLEQSARYWKVNSDQAGPDPTIPGFNFEMIAGAEYAMDLSKPMGERITGLKVKGAAVKDTDRFTIALSNYRAGGAGGYAMLRGAPLVHDKQLEIRQLLIDEVTRKKVLVQSDYFTRNWSVTPATLQASAAAALRRERPFDAVSGGETRAPSAASNGAKATAIRIISTNDFHGALEARPDGTFGMRGGAGQLATAIGKASAECAPPACAALLLDGGDLFQGTPASNLAFGKPIVALFNTLGYAAVALGNHEFDWGVDSLRARIREAKFAFLAANMRRTDGSPVEWARADTIVERGGVKIGIVGVASVLTPKTTKAINVAGLRFDDPAPIVDAHARSLRARGAELVVVVAHDGGFCNRDTGCSGEIFNMAQQLTEPVDAIVSGHTHSLVNTVVKGIPIVQARSSGRSIAVVDLPLDRAARATAKHEVRNVVSDSLAVDPAADAIARGAMQSVAALVSQPIAKLAATMERRGTQYALGNFIADAQRVAAKADVAVMNNGGIRAELRAGDVTYGSLFEIQPFANTLVKVTLRGKDLRAYLEALVGKDELREHVSGVIVRFDKSKPSGSRIVSVTVGGAPLDDARSYTLAYTDFMATGAEGLKNAAVALSQVSADMVDLDALIAFARSQPGGVIAPDPTLRLSNINP